MSTDLTMFCVPADPQRAAALAMQDAVRSRLLWRCHAQARRLTDRVKLADLAHFYEMQVIRTADHLITLGEASQ